MIRYFGIVSMVLACWLSGATRSHAQGYFSSLVSQTAAETQGLHRAWFTQVSVNRAQGHVVSLTLDGDTLFVQTDRAMIEAIDAESGRRRWVEQVGSPLHPSMQPAANDKYVAVVNGSHLYVLDRVTGLVRWDKQLPTSPGAGSALTPLRVYVPLITGQVVSYRLDKPKSPPWMYWSAGRAMVQPIAAGKSVVWPTHRGHVYFAQIVDAAARSGNPSIRFRLETGDEITSQPSYHDGYFYVSSQDGYVYAVDSERQQQAWRFSAGAPCHETPVVIGDSVYACADRAGMYSLDAKSGQQQWWTPEVARFLAASHKYVYGTDKINRLLILDAATGARRGMLRIPGASLFYVNTETDRIYIGTEHGLLQCLHEAELTEPLVHAEVPPAKEEPVEPAEKPTETEPDQPAPPAENPFAEPPAENPFAVGGGDAPPAENPFGGGEAAPADDPFGAAGGDDAPPADDPFAAGGDAAPPDENPFGNDGGNDEPDQIDDDPFN